MRPIPVVGVLLFSLLCSCSNQPAPPAKGTPAFYWQAAQESYAAGDFMKTNDHLEQLLKSQNEFTERARPWRLVMLSGMLRGYLDFAEKFEYGGRENKTNPTPFRKSLNDARSVAGNLTMQLLESWRKFKAAKPAEVVLDFPFPSGSAAPVAALVQASKGILLPPVEIEKARKAAVQRGVVLAVTDSVGAGDDAAKGRAAFQTPPAKVSLPVFAMSMAKTLFDGAQLYDARKLDRPDLLKALSTEALELIKEAPESKEKKELTAKIQEVLKKANARKTS